MERSNFLLTRPPFSMISRDRSAIYPMKNHMLLPLPSQAKYGAILLGILSSLAPLRAQVDGTWISTTSGTQLWSTATNWSSNPSVPGGIGSTVSITSNITNSTTVDLESTDRTVGILNIGDATGTTAFTIAGTGGGRLIFQRDGGAIIAMNQGGNNTISAGVMMNSDLVVNNNLTTLNSQSLTISGQLAGTGNLTINGPGRAYLSADNTSYAGNVTINNVEVSFFFGNATQRSLGSGTITLNGATLDNPGGGKTLTNNFNWAGSLTFQRGTSFTFSGGIALSETATINALTNTTISGAISGNHNLIINAAADRSVSLQGNNTFTGYVDVQQGTLSLRGGSAITDTGEVRVSGGTLNLVLNSETIGSLVMSSGNITGDRTTLNLTASNFQFTNSGTVDVVQLSGAGATLTKTGNGVLSLNRLAGNNYGGGTTVSSGTLVVNNTSGSATGTGAVSVAAGAALGGDGIISGAVSVSGSLRPGNSIGALTIANDVTWNAGDTWIFELGSSADSLALAATGASTQDQLLITASGDFLRGSGSSWTFDFAGGGEEGWYELVTWAGATNFTASDFTATNLTSGLVGTFFFDDTNSGLYLNISAIPEPSAVMLVGAGLALTGVFRKRRSAMPSPR